MKEVLLSSSIFYAKERRNGTFAANIAEKVIIESAIISRNSCTIGKQQQLEAVAYVQCFLITILSNVFNTAVLKYNLFFNNDRLSVTKGEKCMIYRYCAISEYLNCCMINDSTADSFSLCKQFIGWIHF